MLTTSILAEDIFLMVKRAFWNCWSCAWTQYRTLSILKGSRTIDVDATKKKVTEMIANGIETYIAIFGGSHFFFLIR